MNNSGTNWAEDFESYPDSAFDKLYAVNVKAVFNLTKHLLPLLSKRATREKPTSVINIGSIHGIRVPLPDTFAYSATKAAVHHLTSHMAATLVNKNINVNAIACGLFWTKMTAGVKKALEKQIVASVPKQRAGDESDIGKLVVYLCSASWQTGTIIPLDGGAMLKSNF